MKLLQEFHEELITCMEHEQSIALVSVGGPPSHSQVHDPILLGDFIVDAYNNYLAHAKDTCDDPIIQRMSEIEKLGEVDYDAIPDSLLADETDRHEHIAIVKGILMGRNPRVQKMREVALATKQLLTVLEGLIESEDAKTQNEIAGVMTLLENLGQQIGRAQEEGEGSIRHLVEEYNRCLEIVLEGSEDAVLARMFRPLEPVVDEAATYRDKLSELRLAQSGLLSYLQKMHERSG
jgi:hypothetical protein